MLPLICCVQNYDWGKVGPESEVYNLLTTEKNSPDLDDTVPYAELWMGTHPNGPAVIRQTGVLLGKYITEYPTTLGAAVRKKFGLRLPFLLKVLSIRKALSIQAHPDKELAVLLNQTSPQLYKDPNHKPELAIALTPFEALIGFRPLTEIAYFAQNIPELREILGDDVVNGLSSVICTSADDAEEADENSGPVMLKAAYSTLMQADPDLVANLVGKLAHRLANGQSIICSSESDCYGPPEACSVDVVALAGVYQRLVADYPGDVGCLSLFFLNYLTLQPGEAVFLEANLPHAYLSGDAVECMACSDNVVRAGLTPKFKDVECLLSMLNYESRSPDSLHFPGVERRCQPIVHAATSCIVNNNNLLPRIQSFCPPIDDFAVDMITMPVSCPVFELGPLQSASLLIIVRGRGQLFKSHWTAGAADTQQQQRPRVPSLTVQPTAPAEQVLLSTITSLATDESAAGTKLTSAVTISGPASDSDGVVELAAHNERLSRISMSDSEHAGFIPQVNSFSKGSIFFIAAGTPVYLHQSHTCHEVGLSAVYSDDSVDPLSPSASSSSNQSLLAFRAYANVDSDLAG